MPCVAPCGRRACLYFHSRPAAPPDPPKHRGIRRCPRCPRTTSRPSSPRACHRINAQSTASTCLLATRPTIRRRATWPPSERSLAGRGRTERVTQQQSWRDFTMTAASQKRAGRLSNGTARGCRADQVTRMTRVRLRIRRGRSRQDANDLRHTCERSRLEITSRDI